MSTIQNKNMKIDRLVSIIMTLLEKRRVSSQELADMFEVSPRTIYRDIESINLAGIPVLAVPGVNGGFEILPEYKIDKKVFSADELSSILMAVTNLSGMTGGTEAVHALAKLKNIIPPEKEHEINLKVNQIKIDTSLWIGNGNLAPYLEIIKNALQESKLISFTYIDGHSNKSERTIEPYQLVLKGSNWYVQGFCLTKKDFKFFRLSRMLDLKLISKTFTPRDYEEPVLDFDEELQKLQIEIKLRVHKSILDRVLEHCTFDKISLDDEEHYLVNYPFIDREYYYDMLLNFGEKCECLAPESVRQKLKEKIEKLLRVYD